MCEISFFFATYFCVMYCISFVVFAFLLGIDVESMGLCLWLFITEVERSRGGKSVHARASSKISFFF